MTRTRSLSDAELSEAFLDARVAALRWDVVPYALVLDLDVVEQAMRSRVRRAWIAFDGLSDFTWPFDKVRVPRGWFSTSCLRRQESHAGFTSFRFTVLAPQYAADSASAVRASSEVEVIAKSVQGVISIEAAQVDASGPTYEQRVAVASDQELLLGLEYLIRAVENAISVYAPKRATEE